MKFSLAFVLIVWAGGLRAQGLVFNDEAYKNTAIRWEHTSGSKDGGSTSKDIFKVDLRPYCPSVRAQGKVSSCVGWSVGYAAMTIERAVLNGWGGNQRTIDENAFSAMYLYNQIKLGDCYFGAELNQAFEVLKQHGNVFYRDFAVGNNCDSLPPQKLLQKARTNRVSDFTALFSPDEKEDVKIQRVKATLIRRKPVVIGMVVLENFLSLKSGDEVWYPNVGKTDLFGGHAIVVVGFDDGKKAFEIMNSWGEGWANRGFVWVRYHDFARYCKYAYELELKKEGVTSLQGTIRAIRPVVTLTSAGGAEVAFSSLNFVKNNDRYRMEVDRPPFDFQVLTEDLQEDTYFYVISFDQHLNPVVHWPRDEKLGAQFMGEHGSPQITGRAASLMLPAKFNVFRLSEPGTQYICVLNSRHLFRNFAERLKVVSKMKEDLATRIRQAFDASPAEAYTPIVNSGITFMEDDARINAVFVLLEFSVGNEN